MPGGSRFVAWQLYRPAVGGSRELSESLVHGVGVLREGLLQAIKLPHVETFSGAAC
jgi:hypothetical protein